MIPAGKTTFDRMRLTAQDEARRIETIQSELIAVGLRSAPDGDQVARRDDFLGMVRIIDKVLSDQLLLERLGR